MSYTPLVQTVTTMLVYLHSLFRGSKFASSLCCYSFCDLCHLWLSIFATVSATVSVNSFISHNCSFLLLDYSFVTVMHLYKYCHLLCKWSYLKLYHLLICHNITTPVYLVFCLSHQISLSWHVPIFYFCFFLHGVFHELYTCLYLPIAQIIFMMMIWPVGYSDAYIIPGVFS